MGWAWRPLRFACHCVLRCVDYTCYSIAPFANIQTACLQTQLTPPQWRNNNLRLRATHANSHIWTACTISRGRYNQTPKQYLLRFDKTISLTHLQWHTPLLMNTLSVCRISPKCVIYTNNLWTRIKCINAIRQNSSLKNMQTHKKNS